jgi:hypothetical protein
MDSREVTLEPGKVVDLGEIKLALSTRARLYGKPAPEALSSRWGGLEMTARDRFATNGPNYDRRIERRRFAVIVAAAGVLVFASHSMPVAQVNAEPPKSSGKTLAVRVTFEGKPVAGAEVVAVDVENRIRAVTNREGRADLPLAADGKINCIATLDARLGLGGCWFGFIREVPAPPGTVFELPLTPAATHTLRVIDRNGQGVRLASIGVSIVATKSDWFQTGGLDGAHVHTDSRGEARIAWMPRDLKSLRVEVTDDRWKIDDCRTEGALTVVKVRPLHPVDGRVQMPEGRSPEGLWVTGTGMDRVSVGHRPLARVRPDGTFTLYVAAENVYSLCVVDNKWASNSWMGVILTKEDATPEKLVFIAYPAVTLTVRVTRGSKHKPVEGAWVLVRSGEQLHSHDAEGLAQFEAGGPQRVLYTDKNGQAQFAVGMGTQEVFMATDGWREHRTAKVKSDVPVAVDYHRP